MDNGTNWIELLGLLLSLVGALGIVTYLHSHCIKTWSDAMTSQAYRQNLIERYDNRGADGYYQTLARLLGWAERFYEPPLSLRAFDRCVLLALIYPVLAALLIWLLWQIWLGWAGVT